MSSNGHHHWSMHQTRRRLYMICAPSHTAGANEICLRPLTSTGVADRFRPAALMRRVGFDAAFWTGAVFFVEAGFPTFRYAAHRFRCAAAICFLAAALNVRGFRAGCVPSTPPVETLAQRPPSCRRNSRDLSFDFLSLSLIPTNAAANISGSSTDPRPKLRNKRRAF